MLAPHDAENSQLRDRRLASTQQLFDFFEFFRREAVLADHLRRDTKGWRHIHREFKLLSHFAAQLCREDRDSSQTHLLNAASLDLRDVCSSTILFPNEVRN